jgi:glutaryl-CoA dehydrogenase
MAKGELIGCFGLTEPDAGSDPGAMKTRAKHGRQGLRPDRRPRCGSPARPVRHLAVVWAKVDDGDARSIRGFIVERGMKGFETPTVHGKMSLRASPTGEIVLSDVRVPEGEHAARVRGPQGPLSCLTQARFGISWGALGAARACFESVLATRASASVRQADRGEAARAAEAREMAMEIAKGQIMALHFGRLKDDRRDHPVQVSLCKKNNVGRPSRSRARRAASCGGNGILLEYPVIRHMLNLESVYTYEGTDEVHTLILGQTLTGESAF